MKLGEKLNVNPAQAYVLLGKDTEEQLGYQVKGSS